MKHKSLTESIFSIRSLAFAAAIAASCLVLGIATTTHPFEGLGMSSGGQSATALTSAMIAVAGFVFFFRTFNGRVADLVAFHQLSQTIDVPSSTSSDPEALARALEAYVGEQESANAAAQEKIVELEDQLDGLRRELASRSALTTDGEQTAKLEREIESLHTAIQAMADSVES
ncbi:MAG: hypothetical protein AAGF15_04245, partial [Pseudomonadota bacterium]